MTLAQMDGVADLLNAWKRPEMDFHHGDCVGADAQAHDLAGRVNAKRIVHPPVDNTHRAWVSFYDEIREPKSHFARNRDIVDETDVLIAAPPYMDDITKDTRGGTAYTVNYARKRGKPVYIVRPDGSVIAPEAGREEA